MTDQFSRTRMLLGGRNMEKLAHARVAVIGLGGVGSYALEALARSGVGAFELVDGDMVSLTNLNRQIIALHSTLGMRKTEAAAARAKDISPETEIRCFPIFLSAQNIGDLPFAECDYIVDAIDTVTGKLMLVEEALRCGTPIISSMGTGNKLDPTAFRVADITQTAVCPLARIMRKELKKRGIEHLKVVYSREKPLEPKEEAAESPEQGRRDIPGSVAFVPGVAGLILAGEVVRDLTHTKGGELL